MTMYFHIYEDKSEVCNVCHALTFYSRLDLHIYEFYKP